MARALEESEAQDLQHRVQCAGDRQPFLHNLYEHIDADCDPDLTLDGVL